MRGSREISLVPSLHRASTDALIMCFSLCAVYVTLATKRFGRVKHWLVAGIMTFPHKEPVK